MIAAALVFFFAHLTPALTSKDSILVTAFTNTTGNAAFNGTLRTALEVSLEQSPYFNVVSGQQIAHALALMEQPANAIVTAGIGQQICQRNQIKALLHPSIASLGSQYVITLQALDAASGATLAETQATTDSPSTVLAALDAASTRLRRKLGESLASIHEFNQPLAEATTSSLPALQAYTLAEQQWAAGNNPAAILAAQHALALDPNFAMAWRLAAAAEGNLNNIEASIQDGAKAFSLRYRASERERMQITAMYYLLIQRYSKSVRAYQTLTQTYPRDFLAWADLADAYSELGQFPQWLQAAL
ncbi:MAG: hypothetical protein ACRD04_01800 [Terriglobales bacterium]